jgi:flagellar FliL protein
MARKPLMCLYIHIETVEVGFKLKIVLEVPDQALILQIQPLMPRVMDAFQTYLRELRPNDLEGSAGLYRLKEELTRRVNAAIEPARINAVLFKELLVQ